MTASFNISFFNSSAAASSREDVKRLPLTASNNYTVDVVDFDNDIFTFEVEAESASEASKQAEDMAMSQGIQVSYCNVYSIEQ